MTDDPKRGRIYFRKYAGGKGGKLLHTVGATGVPEVKEPARRDFGLPARPASEASEDFKPEPHLKYGHPAPINRLKPLSDATVQKARRQAQDWPRTRRRLIRQSYLVRSVFFVALCIGGIAVLTLVPDLDGQLIIVLVSTLVFMFLGLSRAHARLQSGVLSRIVAATYNLGFKAVNAPITGLAFNWEWHSNIKFNSEGMLQGSVSGHQILVAHASFDHHKFTMMSNRTEIETLFNGVIGQIDMETGIKSRIVILPDDPDDNELRGRALGLDRVSLNCASLEGRFEVYALDPQEAAQILDEEALVVLTGLPRLAGLDTIGNAIKLEIMPQHVRFALDGSIISLASGPTRLPVNLETTIESEIKLVKLIIRTMKDLLKKRGQPA